MEPRFKDKSNSYVVNDFTLTCNIDSKKQTSRNYTAKNCHSFRFVTVCDRFLAEHRLHRVL